MPDQIPIHPALPSTWQPAEPPPDIGRHEFLVGTSGYHYDDWVGVFNPPRRSGRQLDPLSAEERDDQDRLRFYQKYFSFVEINNTFYRPPMIGNFMDIERRSKESMKYAVKVHRDISHTKTWDAEPGREMMRHHITAVSPLVETGRFYSFLIQLEDRTMRTQERLDYLLEVATEAVRRRVDVHIEFRHNSWHDVYPLQSLKDHGIGICNTEIPPVPHAFPLKSYATTDKGYVRYSGRRVETWYPQEKQKTGGRTDRKSAKERLAARNARYDYLYSEEQMRERVKGQLQLSKKVSSVAVAFNNHYNTQAVQNAIQNIRMLQVKLKAADR